MRCRPGDLAVIEGSRHHPALNGVIVHVLYLYKFPYWECRGYVLEEYCDRNDLHPRILDSKLRPIRGQPGTDEMLRITGKPNHKEKTT